eukprot:scaffold95406_cov59-Attheya_sp.AAC.1
MTILECICIVTFFNVHGIRPCLETRDYERTVQSISLLSECHHAIPCIIIGTMDSVLQGIATDNIYTTTI